MIFATIDDYSARYGEPADGNRTAVLLQDAADLIVAAYEEFYGIEYCQFDNETFDRSAKAVCCMIVNRVLNSPAALAGATSYSQGAGGYSASVTYGSALGEMYLGKSDLKRLGLNGQVMRTLTPIKQGSELWT